MISIAGAGVFLVALFLIKNTSLFKNEEVYGQADSQNGLTYSKITIGELVEKDTDEDGIPDWEEGLYGTDPTKKETTQGVPDSTAIANLKASGENSSTGKNLGPENLTKTDQFSRDLFATVAATTQNGSLDQTTADQITSSLADKVQNSKPRKVYLLADIEITNDNSAQAVKKYNDALDNILIKYPVKGSALEILQRFVVDENNVDTTVLPELDPIIGQTNKIISALVKTNVPQYLAQQHLDFLNAMERVNENLSDIRLYDSDSIVALGGISQYDQNATDLASANNVLADAIQKKLNN